MMEHRIIQGDCIETLKTLASESVHCCVTSPPYFGLRDYGTAQWDISATENTEIAEKCDHKIETTDDRKFANGRGEVDGEYSGKSLTSWTHRDATVKGGQACAKCGAVRIDSQIGLEATPQEFIAAMVAVFEEVRRVLRADGVLFLNLGDSYNGGNKGNSGEMKPHYKQSTNVGSLDTRRGESLSPFRKGGANGFCKPKDLMLMPHRVAIALQEAGWWVRSDMPWVKRSAMPESVTDRPAKALEYVFMLTKSERYFYDAEAVRTTSITNDPRRPYGSKGAWEMDGRPESQRHGGKIRESCLPDTWKGSSFSKGKTAEHQLGRAQKDRDRSLPANRNGITEHLDKTPAGSRNFRNADLWFSSIKEPHGLVSVGDELVGLDVNPSGFKDAHFATFPPKLIEPLIKAGTSEHGCCAACGSPESANHGPLFELMGEISC